MALRAVLLTVAKLYVCVMSVCVWHVLLQAAGGRSTFRVVREIDHVGGSLW